MKPQPNSQRHPKRLSFFVGALLAIISTTAWSQSAILQGGAWTPGHAPMYVGQGGSQPVVQDSGPASGGGPGLGLSELNIIARGTGTAPYAGQGTGQYGTNACDYDGPTTGPFHYFCWSPNAQGGGLIAVGAAGGASALPFNFILNGTTYAFPFVTGGIVGPGTTTVNHLAVWNNATGTLLADTATLPAGTTIPIATTTFTGQLAVANGGTGAATLTPNGVVYGQGTNPAAITAAPSQYNVLVGNVSGVPAFGQVNLAQSAAVTGTLGVTNGGTGAATLTAHAVLLGEGTSAPGFATIGTSGRLLIDQGAGADPSFNAMSQDCTITNAGVITCLKTNNVAFGTAAAANTGTSGANVPLLNGNNTFSGTATFSSQIISTAGLPTIASGACGTGTNGAVVSGSTNQTGNITIGASATTSCAVSFSATLGTAPNACLVFPTNAAAAATGTTVARVSSITTSQFVITGSALANANYAYHCI